MSDVIFRVKENRNLVWDVNTQTWVAMTQPGSGGAGGDVNVTNTSLAVTGTFWQTTQPISVATLPLPTGAALESSLSALNGKVPAQINSRIPITTGVKYGDFLSIGTDPGFPMLGINPTTFQWVGIAVGDTTPVGSEVGVFTRNIPSGTQAVSAATLPLPTNASTSALQTTGNTSLANIDTKTPALGQALAAASTPVVLTAAQLTTLTPPAAITGFATEAGNLATIAAKDFATQTTLALIKAKTDNIDVALSTRTKPADAQHVIIDSGTTAATQSGTWTVQPGNTANTTAWKVDGSAVTQPVSGSVSVGNFPASQAVTGTFWQSTQPVSVAATLAVSGPLTDTQLRATPVPISGTISASSVATATAADPTYTEAQVAAISQDLAGRLRTLGYGLVNDTPQIYVPNDIKPISVTPEGRLRVSVSEARVASAPFSQNMEDMWGTLQAWDESSSKPYQPSPWNDW